MFFFKYLSRGFLQRFRRIGQDSKGIALLETVMAITIFAALGTALMVGIRTANISGEVVEDQSVAEKLARNQMEYVFNQSYLNPPSILGRRVIEFCDGWQLQNVVLVTLSSWS